MKNGMDIPTDYAVYCFDIFDTIVSRKVYPEYVKKLWAKEIRERILAGASCSSIYKLRNRLEADLCSKNERQGYCLEFQYETMLEQMYEKLNIDHLGITKEIFIQICYDIELEIEKRVQFLCPDTFAVIKRLKEMGKKIYCVSDFYMREEFIEAMFQYHGILSNFDGFFISSQTLLTKRDGRLYDYVLERLGRKAEEVYMIGDNAWSDVESARNHGIAAFHIDRGVQQTLYGFAADPAQVSGGQDTETDGEKYQNHAAAENIMELYRKCQRDDYEDLTFALYHFIEKLYYELRRQNIKNVFFLSREGEFLKKLFDQYQSCRNTDDRHKIRTHYFMVSRKSTFMVSLRPLESETFEMIFRQYIHISLYDFLSSLGFSKEEQEGIGAELGVDIWEKKADFPNDVLYGRLRKNSTFQKLYEEKRTVQKTNFAKYLDSFGVAFRAERFCLVDVGWKGTIQDNLYAYFQGESEIDGFYLGLVAPGKIVCGNRKKGLLFDCVNVEKSAYFDVYNENKSIFEVILGASHGSADSYQIVNGKVVAKTAQKKEERDLYVHLIQPIQDRIFALFHTLDQKLLYQFYDITSPELEKIWADIQARLVFLPTKKQTDIFYKIYHFENFGIFAFTRFKTNEEVSIVQRFRNVRRLFREKGAFFEGSFWRIVTLRDAGLSLLIRPCGHYLYRKYYKDRGTER